MVAMEAAVKHVEEEQKPELDPACHLVVSVLDLLLRWSNVINKHVHVRPMIITHTCPFNSLIVKHSCQCI